MNEVNLDQVFSLIALSFSIISGRISIVFMRGEHGFIDDVFSSLIAIPANLMWGLCLVWFYLNDFWILPIVVAFLAIFVIGKFIHPQRIMLWKLRNIVRIVSVVSGIFIWKSWFGF